MNCRPTNSPMPQAAQALIYKQDLQNAVERLDNCWNTTQIADVLNSINFFSQVMKTAMERK